uniref:Uncharacterized protein n=1 Tax=Oryza meridionalis TaxID=40149 RepID=A0A0E0DZF4_9ORYZ
MDPAMLFSIFRPSISTPRTSGVPFPACNVPPLLHLAAGTSDYKHSWCGGTVELLQICTPALCGGPQKLLLIQKELQCYGTR